MKDRGHHIHITGFVGLTGEGNRCDFCRKVVSTNQLICLGDCNFTCFSCMPLVDNEIILFDYREAEISELVENLL